LDSRKGSNKNISSDDEIFLATISGTRHNFRAMRRQRVKYLLLFLLFLLGNFPFCAAAVTRNDGAIWFPRLPTPVLVALDTPADRQFIAEIRASANAHDWSASISNDLKAWPCRIISATYAKINRRTEPGWRIQVSVPANASPELFDLTLSSSEGVSIQKQSVSVMPMFATDFYILHISDEQIVNDQHTDPSGTYCRTVGTAEEMTWMQEPVNLIHPRFVCITGDQIDYNGALDGWNNWPNWGYKPGAHKHFSVEETKELEKRLSEMYLDCHRGYRVPYVEAPGNHDVTPADKKLFDTNILWHPISVEAYENYFGQRSWSFRMGDFYVLMHDWTDRGLKDWAAADYAAAMADPTIKYRLIGQHFHTDQAFMPAACDLMLIGHGHTVATIQSSPYYVYEVGPSFKYGISGFFNFRKTPDGWACDQTKGPRDVSKDVFHLFTDNGITKTVRTNRPDSMNISEHSVTITNDLPEEFYDGRVRFVLDKGVYHSVRNGVILVQYNCGNDSKTAVLVKVDIPAKGTIIVGVE
jgi:hypothetical protein